VAGQIEDYAVGFLPADEPRVVSTMKVRRRDLLPDGFLRRHGLSGRHEEAIELFDRLLRSVPG
jgi:hypothetical protein